MTQEPDASPVARSDFDARAATWDDDPTKRERALAIAAAIVREVPLAPDLRVLEYGAGTGLLTFALRDRVGEVVLADVSDGMLAVAREKIAARGETRMSAQSLDLLTEPSPGRFDLIYSAMTLHHIPDTAGILARWRDALQPGGRIAIADLDAEDGSFHGAEADVHRGFDRAALAALARDAGFRDVRFTTAYVMRKGGRDFPIFLLTATR